MGKLSLFEISLESPQVVYYPDQTLNGYVKLTLKKPMKMRSIKIKLKGESYCHWKQRVSKKTTVSAKEHIIEETCELFGGQSKSELHPSGTYTYPFSFVLSDGIPSSFEGKFGYIRYVLKCTIEKPWKFDQKVKRPIVINYVIDTNDPIYANPVEGNLSKKFGWLCCKAGSLEFNSSIDRSCYCPGEAILVNANIRNNTSRNMKAINVRLFQTVTYKAHTSGRKRTKIQTEEVTNLYGPSIPKGKDVVWQNQAFTIPAVPPTITTSGIISVCYKFEFYVGNKSYVKMDITIGTVPFLRKYGQSVQYGTPEDQQGPPTGCLDNYIDLPPPSPNVIGYPPPSYSSVVGDRAVNIKKDKDSHTQGDLMYQPVYTFTQPYQGSLAPVPLVPNLLDQ